MTWNFRLVRHIHRKTRAKWYGVHEVFYNESGKPWAMTEDPIDLDGESPKEVLAYLKLVRRDLQRLPILDARTIKWATPPEGIRSGPTKRFKNLKALMTDLRKG